VFVLFLALLRAKQEKAPDRSLSLQALLMGARFAWRQRLLLTTISLDLFAVLLGGAVYLLPVYARDILAVGERGLGWLRSAPALGSLCMAMLLAHLPPMRRAGRNLLLAVAGFGLATVVFGFSKSFWLSWAMLFLTGLFDNVSVVVRHTLQQLLTPDDMRGRVSAVTSIFIGSSNELGGFESGLVARVFSPVVSVVSGGIGTLCVVAITALASPALRRFGSMASVRPAAPPQAGGRAAAG
jgi:MFS family permease